MLPSDAPALRAIPRCAPEFLEQPNVLDGDDGLVGEGFEQFDLSVRERTHFNAAYNDDTDRRTLSEQRRYQDGANTRDPVQIFALGILVIKYRLHVRNVNGPAV